MAVLSLKPAPASLRPVVRAYLLGYGAIVVPQILGLILKSVKRLGKAKDDGSHGKRRRPKQPLLRHLVRILIAGLNPQRVPTFCALLAAGCSLFQV